MSDVDNSTATDAMIRAGLDAADLYEIAAGDILTKSHIKRFLAAALTQHKPALPDGAQSRIRELESAIRRCIVDLEAARLLAQHTLGEPHGINQTLDIARAALTTEK